MKAWLDKAAQRHCADQTLQDLAKRIAATGTRLADLQARLDAAITSVRDTQRQGAHDPPRPPHEQGDSE
jgi:uncharacterized coiled-coil protein SlyX